MEADFQSGAVVVLAGTAGRPDGCDARRRPTPGQGPMAQFSVISHLVQSNLPARLAVNLYGAETVISRHTLPASRKDGNVTPVRQGTISQRDAIMHQPCLSRTPSPVCGSTEDRYAFSIWPAARSRMLDESARPESDGGADGLIGHVYRYLEGQTKRVLLMLMIQSKAPPQRRKGDGIGRYVAL